MPFEEIIYDVTDRIATITLNRPEKLNAWTRQMEAEYRQAMADAEQDDEVRVIVVTGAGRGFCAGADMSLLSAAVNNEIDTSEDPVKEWAQPGARDGVRPDFQKQYSFPLAVEKPVLCAVNGHAVGLGFVHMLYCDIRFASDQAKFGAAFSQRGLIAEWGISWMLPRLVGPANALDLLFSSRIITAEEAYRMGLVSRVVPHDELMSAVREYAAHLATQCSPRSLAIMKRELWNAQFTDLAAACDEALEDMLASFGSEDFKEGVQSFIEKRPPRFTGQ